MQPAYHPYIEGAVVAEPSKRRAAAPLLPQLRLESFAATADLAASAVRTISTRLTPIARPLPAAIAPPSRTKGGRTTTRTGTTRAGKSYASSPRGTGV